MGRKIILAFQTLGVVFGDIGTSPLYTFDVMFTKAPINGNEDILGALSLLLYTLILILLVKYVFVVLWTNDDGEGGTFALYSLIFRHAKVSLLPNQLPSDACISSFRLKVPSPELERSLKIKERLETSLVLKKLLLMLVIAGTSMVITDGVITPAMSVTSAVAGLKVGVSAITQDQVVMILVAFIVILFSLQKIYVRITNLPVYDQIRNIRQIHLNTMIRIGGVVTRRSGVFPQLQQVKYDCNKCGAILGTILSEFIFRSQP